MDEKTRSSSSVRHSRSWLSDLWDSQSNANPITVQCKEGNGWLLGTHHSWDQSPHAGNERVYACTKPGESVPKGSICGWVEALYGCNSSTRTTWSRWTLHLIVRRWWAGTAGRRFWSQLHFGDNNDFIPRGQPGHDRLFKIRNLLRLIIPRFNANYQAGKELALDEMIIAFTGRSTLNDEAELLQNSGCGLCRTCSATRKGMPHDLRRSNLTLEKGDPPVYRRSHGRPQKIFQGGAKPIFCLSFCGCWRCNANWPILKRTCLMLRNSCMQCFPCRNTLHRANVCFSEHAYFKTELAEF